ncbi:MAG: peptidylprolyl isomerase [Candidatus Latescibacterota bacterium]
MKYHLHPALIFAASLLFSPAPSQGDAWSDRKPVQYRLRQILLEPTPSARHDGAVLNKAVEILNRAREGDDFAALAKKYSQEPGADRTGGDLGFFTADQMVKPFSEAVFSMKPGEIRGPVKTQFGYHIIKLLDVRGPKRHAQHVLFTLIPDRADSNATMNTLKKIRNQIESGTSFDEMCSRYNTLEELRRTEGYMVWQKPEEMLDEFRKAVGGLKPGEVSQPFVSIIGFHLVQVDSINYSPETLFQGFPVHIERRLREHSER